MDQTTFDVLMRKDWFRGLAPELTDGLSAGLIQRYLALVKACEAAKVSAPTLTEYADEQTSDLKAWIVSRAMEVAEDALFKAADHSQQAQAWAQEAARHPARSLGRYTANIHTRHHQIEDRRNTTRLRNANKAIARLAPVEVAA